LAQRDGLAVAGEREAADAHLAALRLGSCLREADAGDLRGAVGATRYLQLVERVRAEPLDGLHTHHALVLGLVRQHRRPGNVADGVDARYVGAPVAVDDDGAAVDSDAQLLEPEAFDVA